MEQKKKFITPKMRVIKLDSEELMQTGSPTNANNPTTSMRNGKYVNQTGGDMWGESSDE